MKYNSNIRVLNKSYNGDKMIIDVHTHVFPDNLAGKAIAKLSASSGLTPSTDGTVSGLTEKLGINNIDKAIVLNIATKPMQDTKVNDFAIETAREHSDSLIVFGSVNPYSPIAVEELYRLSRAGIKGVKLHPEYQRFEVTDSICNDVYKAISDLGLVVTFHAGYDVAFPDSNNASPTSLAKVIDKFPDMKVICAHMGGMLKWQEVYDVLAGKNCYLDTAMCAGYLDIEMANKIIEKHGVDRILFGTDAPWNNWQDTINFVEKLNLTGEDKEKIYHINVERLLGMR